MGCVVNGVGEAKAADVGIFFPGNGEYPKIPIYVRGKQYKVLVSTDDIFGEFMEILEAYFEGII